MKKINGLIKIVEKVQETVIVKKKEDGYVRSDVVNTNAIIGLLGDKRLILKR